MDKFFHNLGFGINELSRIGGLVAGVCIFAAAVASFYGVFMRYVFENPPLFVDEIEGYLLLGAIFMAWAWTLKLDAHINVAILLPHLPKRVQNLLGAITLTVGLVWILLLTKWAFAVWYSNLELGVRSSTPMQVSLWIPQMALILGLPLFALQLIVEIVRKIKAFYTE